MILAAARENMVDSQVRTSDVSDVRLQAAMRSVARERFVAPASAELAYSEQALPLAEGRVLMQPRDVAKLLQALQPREGERALVICEPYAAALLARMGLEVTALDTAAAAARVGAALEEEGVESLAGDPASPEVQGSFDLILGGGSAASAPAAWTERLNEGGRLALVIREATVGRATLFVRGGGSVTGRAVFEAFPPWLPGLEPKPAFAF